MKYFFFAVMLTMSVSTVMAYELTVAPDGDDTNPGSSQKPFATLHRAQEAVRQHAERSTEPATVVVRAGTYYLSKTLVFTASDSGSKAAPVSYKAETPGEVIISGGMKLLPQWKPYRDGILQAKTPAGLQIDQLFVNGQRRHMARYPNYDANARPYNGAAADAFSPSRAVHWADPTGGYIHAMHRAHWGGYHYRITGKNENNEVSYEGGWQNNRQMGMHKSHRFVENIFEELNAPGEWYHDSKNGTLYYLPDENVDVNAALFEVVKLRHLVEFQGTREKPTHHISLSGFIFRHAARTFMDTKEPLLRSDWTVYRGGAIFLTGVEDCTISDCEFDQLGGNSIFASNYNRRIAVRGCHIHGSGASGICFVGNPDAVRNPLFEYHQRQEYKDIDMTPGPKTDNYPADCIVDDCLIHNVSVVEKQATGVQISMSKGITVRHCSIYDVGRAGINISEGTFGGHIIEFCDVFDTVRETGDHGSFNSWGRDRFWGLKDAPAEELAGLALLDAEKTIIRNSRWRCDHGWDVDLDDGSSNFEIYNNVFLNGGLKLREGFHRRVWNNIGVNSTLHAHVWYKNSMDILKSNIWMKPYPNPIRMPEGKWGIQNDYNLFTTEAARKKAAAHGWDHNSIIGDPGFIDSENGDYRVKEDSPALKLGFKNFPMDRFGVQKAQLKAIARTPKLPELKLVKTVADNDAASYWQGATIRNLSGEEFSAFGVSKEDGGVHLKHVPSDSFADRAGLKTNNLIQAVNGIPVKTTADLLKETDRAKGKPLKIKYVHGQQSKMMTMKSYVYVVTESTDAEFKDLKVRPSDKVLKFKSVSTNPKTANEPLSVLSDGKLTANYGPVFSNGVVDGVYIIDLGKDVAISEVSTWSFNMGGVRGSQKFTVFGISEKNVGQDSQKGTQVPIAVVDTTAEDIGKFAASRIRSSDGSEIGRFRQFKWVVQPVANPQANTAFQEFQIR
ncbi:MAG: PDZ domain-containing protein [Planctomycetota bacterium]